jgi:hypothetical protein
MGGPYAYLYNTVRSPEWQLFVDPVHGIFSIESIHEQMLPKTLEKQFLIT